jgi:DNA modification methylase
MYKEICGICGAVRIDNQIGLEKTPEEYVAKMVEVFREVKRVLRDDGTLWLNLGDSYAANRTYQVPDGKYKDVGNDKKSEIPEGLKPKDLVGIPWRVAFALQADGWYLRSDIIWSKPNPMPESVTDRPTKAHEYVFLLSKKAKYYYDADAVREPLQECSIERAKYGWNGTMVFDESGKETYRSQPDPVDKMGERWSPSTGRNRRTVWEIATQPTPEAHFATFPEALVEPCIKAGTSERGCCPVCGAGWERVVEKESPPMEVYTKTNVKEDVGDFIYKARKDGIKVGYGQKYQNWRNDNPPLTTGWQPTCTCSHDETIPCT